MKKLLTVLLAVVLAASLTACGKNKSDFDPMAEFGADTLNIFNAGEYIDPTIITKFKKQYNVTINYDTFQSNEDMYTALMKGTAYDILIPSDYMIQRLIKEGMLQPIDKSIVTNLDKLYEGVQNLDWDPDNTYAVPYFWGNVGIVYDTTKVDIADLEKEGFGIFLDTKYAGHIYLYDSMRDAFMMAFKDLGYSMNTSDEKEIEDAYNWLLKLAMTMHAEPADDEAIDGLTTGLKWMGMMYSGDAAAILSDNEDMGYYVPDYGTNFWVDAMVIPANSAHAKLANFFINYILEYDVSYANSEYVGYSSSNGAVFEDISTGDGPFADNEAYRPRTDNPNDETFVHNEFLNKKLAELWVYVKLKVDEYR